MHSFFAGFNFFTKEPKFPMIVVMAGLPGTGKSSIAAQLQKRFDALVLNKDEVRSKLFSKEKIDYSRGQDDLCMKVIYLVAECVLRANPEKTVIIDGRTFSKRYQVEQLLSHGSSLKVKPAIIECVCDDAVAKERLENDLRKGVHPAGNRTYRLYSALKANAEPITADRLVIDTGKESLKESMERCAEYVSSFALGTGLSR
jgi:adenylylsulfate kinase